jgi:hypothetical protein
MLARPQTCTAARAARICPRRTGVALPMQPGEDASTYPKLGDPSYAGWRVPVFPLSHEPAVLQGAAREGTPS